MTGPLEDLMSRVEGDVVILRAPSNWNVDQVRKILVPSGGRRDQSPIRARLIGNLCRTAPREVTYLRVLPTTTDAATERRARRELRKLARDEAPDDSTVEVHLERRRGRGGRRAGRRLRSPRPRSAASRTTAKDLRRQSARDRRAHHLPAADDQPPQLSQPYSCEVQLGQRVALMEISVMQNSHSLVVGSAAGASSLRLIEFMALMTMNTAMATIRKLITVLMNIP